jgi:hypothetical protein
MSEKREKSKPTNPGATRKSKNPRLDRFLRDKADEQYFKQRAKNNDQKDKSHG